MDYKLLMNTAILAGEIMLKSGAETYRVEDTINRILETSNAQTVETVVLMTGIFVTLDDAEFDPITVNKRVHARGMNLNRIDRVNTVSRSYCAGELSLQEAYEMLKQIHSKQYRRMSYNLATVFVCAGFARCSGGAFRKSGEQLLQVSYWL